MSLAEDSSLKSPDNSLPFRGALVNMKGRAVDIIVYSGAPHGNEVAAASKGGVGGEQERKGDDAWHG